MTIITRYETTKEIERGVFKSFDRISRVPVFDAICVICGISVLFPLWKNTFVFAILRCKASFDVTIRTWNRGVSVL